MCAQGRRAGGPILITGVGGQVGAAAARLAEAAGTDARALGRAELDVTDEKAVDEAVEATRPAAVVNCAAFTDVDAAEERWADARAVNALAPGYLATAAARIGAAVVHLSTDYVFGGRGERPFRESDRPDPINAYGRSKLEGEEAVRSAAERHLIVRTSWVFARGHANFVATMLRLASEREELRVVTDQVGSPTPAAALAAELLRLAGRIASGEELPWGTYHLAGEPPVSRFELAEAVVAAARRAGPVRCRRIVPALTSEFPAPAARPPYSALDSSLARQTLGTERIDWRDGVRALVEG